MTTKNKAKAVKYSQNETDKIIKEKKEHNAQLKKEREEQVQKELIDTQKSYRIRVKERVLKEYELEEIRKQINMSEGTKNVQPEMLWYGMPYPLKILKATYNLGIESYVQKLNDEKELREKLFKKYKLTKKEVEGVLNGEYVRENRT